MNEIPFNIQNLETKVENTLLNSLEKKTIRSWEENTYNRHETEM